MAALVFVIFVALAFDFFNGFHDAANEIATVVSVEGSQAVIKPGQVVVRVDPHYYRPTEVETLLGDASKARINLGWTPQIGLPDLVREMVAADYAAARRDGLVKSAGFQAYDYNE